MTVISFVDAARSDGGGDNASSALDMVAPAALLGVFGLIVMAGLTKRSDRAAAAAGSVAVPERTRTVALATAVVVPLAAALLWFVAVLIAYRVNPPSPSTVPFGPVSDGYVFVVMFALGVVPARRRPDPRPPDRPLGAPPGRRSSRSGPARAGDDPDAGQLPASTWHWRVVWPWTYWYGPVGWDTGTGHWAVLPGSPQLWVVYLLAVCALGVLAAIYHDPESDSVRLRMLIAGVVVVAAVALTLTMTLGVGETVYNPSSRRRRLMLRHAARGVPWSLIAAAALLIPGLLAFVRYDPWTLWPLQGTAVGLLAGAVGWCLDEPAAAVVDTASARAWPGEHSPAPPASPFCSVTWSAGVWRARPGPLRPPVGGLRPGPRGSGDRDHLGDVAAGRWRSVPGPGAGRSSVVPATTAWALVKPLEKQVPVFPYAFGGEYGDWAVSAAGWTIIGLLACALLALILTREGRPWERIASH